MAILVDRSTRVLVQGLTGREGSFHTQQMQAYGTTVVAGVVPGRGGAEALGVPIFDTVGAAVAATGADTAFTIVPPAFAADTGSASNVGGSGSKASRSPCTSASGSGGTVPPRRAARAWK